MTINRRQFQGLAINIDTVYIININDAPLLNVKSLHYLLKWKPSQLIYYKIKVFVVAPFFQFFIAQSFFVTVQLFCGL